MSRVEVLRRERERVMVSLATDHENRAKWLIRLMDIDDEIEEIQMETEHA